MSNRGDEDLLGDMQEAIRRITTYTGEMSYHTFLNDTRTQDAVIRNLEIIGEAAKNISAELRMKHPDLPCTDMARVRDRLIHRYFGVNLDIVWQIAREELPKVAAQIESIIAREA